MKGEVKSASLFNGSIVIPVFMQLFADVIGYSK